jgi:hypothetical protein
LPYPVEEIPLEEIGDAESANVLGVKAHADLKVCC